MAAVDLVAGGEVFGNGDLSFTDLPDELLIQIMKSHGMTEEILVFICNLKATSVRLHSIIYREMQQNTSYNTHVKRLLLVVKGTKIPCGASEMLSPPYLTGVKNLTRNFNDTMQLADNNIGIGGPFQIGGRFAERSVLDISSQEELDVNVSTYLVAIHIRFLATDYLSNLSACSEKMVDLSRVPNMVRSVFIMPQLTEYAAHVNNYTQNIVMGTYTRMVRVNAENTMQDMQDAIAWREGLVFDSFAMQIHTRDVEEPFTAETTVPQYLQMRQDSTIVPHVTIWWDGQLRPAEESSDWDSSSDYDESDNEIELVLPPAVLAELPTPTVHPVDYPNADTYITPEETVDSNHDAIEDSIDNFFGCG